METINEHRWTTGSYVAAGFALFILIFNLGFAIISTTWPTDGWMVSGNLDPVVTYLMLEQNLFDDTSPLQSGDKLLAINGMSVQQLLEKQHAFFRMQPPQWSGGTVLRYEVLREGKLLTLDVPIQIKSFWQYLITNRQFESIEAIVQLISSLFFFLVGVTVFLLRPGNRAAHALLFIGLAFFFNALPGNYSPPILFYRNLPVSIPFDTWTMTINPSLMYLVLAFPRPKAPLRRFPRLTVGLLYLTWPIVFNIAYLLHLSDRAGYLKIASSTYPIQVILLMVITLVSLVHSAFTVRDPVERSQFKWMLAGIFSFVFIGVGGWLVSSYIFPDTMSGSNWLLTVIGWFLLPICLAIAILRYRLFDIDVIIRRTLVYSLLTGLLALVYFASVVVLQNVFAVTANQQSPVIIIISTLGSALLFSPLRRRIQAVIDRRFYRAKYNAERALAAFAASARDKVEIDCLTDALIITVQETIQPTHTSLWLRTAAAENRHGGRGE